MFKRIDFTVVFDTYEDRDRAYEILNDFSTNVKKRYLKHNPNFKGEIHTEIYSIEPIDDEVLQFEISSPKTSNADFQADMVILLLRESGGMIELNTNAWVESNSISLSDEEDIANYIPNLD